MSTTATPSFNPKNPDNLIPALAPPLGEAPNFVDPESLWRWDVLCMTVCLFFTTVPFVARCYVRLFIKREWLLEDYIACLGWAGFVTYCALTTTVMDRHGGIHQWDVTAADVQEVFFWFNVTTIEYGIAQAAVKLAILMFYRRMFVSQRRSTLDIFLYVCETIILSFYTAITLVKIFECNPRTRIWDRSTPGSCVDINALLNASGSFNLLTDIVILLIPVKSVWGLKMKRKKKFLVIGVFTVGSIAPVFSLIGIIVRIALLNNPDATYYQPEVLLWAAAEVCTGLICLCLPPLSVLLHQSQRGRRRRPSSSILAGDSASRAAASASAAARKATLRSTDDDLLSADYFEPKGGAAVEAAAVARPPDAHVFSGTTRNHVQAHAHACCDDDTADAFGADGSARNAGGSRSGSERSLRPGPTGIVKTVEIKQSYV